MRVQEQLARVIRNLNHTSTIKLYEKISGTIKPTIEA